MFMGSLSLGWSKKSDFGWDLGFTPEGFGLLRSLSIMSLVVNIYTIMIITIIFIAAMITFSYLVTTSSVMMVLHTVVYVIF